MASTRRLSSHDAIATGLLAIAGGLYGWYLTSPDVAVVGSTRWMGVTLFVLGIAACARGADSVTETRGYAGVMSTAGGLAAVLAFVAAVTAYGAVLMALASLLAAMWLVTTARHALGMHIRATGVPPAAAPTRELVHH